MTVAIIWILCKLEAPAWVIVVTIAPAALRVLASILKAVREARKE